MAKNSKPANLDEGSVGVKILAGLPAENGFPAIAAELLDNPREVIALVKFGVKHEKHDVENDSHQITLKIREIEPINGVEGERLRDMMDKTRESRTGQVRLPGIDGVEVPAAVGRTDEWTDEEVLALKQAEGEAAAQEAADDARAKRLTAEQAERDVQAPEKTTPPPVEAPAFTPPTPIRKNAKAK